MSHSSHADQAARKAREIAHWIVERRRALHRAPELSYQEAKTAAMVERELRALGITALRTRLNGNHSLVAELTGQNPSRVIALRADMDALPIQEETEWEAKSRNAGVAHMCGHDAHTAMLLGAAKLLKERESDLPFTVKLFFQGGEETFPGGANDFIDEGELDGVDAIFGLHVDPRHDTGTLNLSPGPMMAGVNEFTLRIDGVGGHAAFPHMTCDPILAASHVVTALQHIVSRREDPFSAAVLSVTQFNAGTAFNVIPPSAELRGTLRSFRTDKNEYYGKLIRETAERTAAAFGCTATLDMNAGYPALVNDENAVHAMQDAAGPIYGDGIHPMEPMMGSEDFALYTARVPGSFAFIGVSKPDWTDRHMVHHPKFFLDEDALWRGAALLATIGLNGRVR